MAIQTFTAAQVLTAAQMNALQANDYNQTVSTKTASYTLVAADKGTRVVMNSASATTITVNTSLFSAGDTLFLQNINAGVCTVTAGTATVSTAGSLAIPQNGSGILYFTSAGVSIFYPSASTQSALTFITSASVSANTSLTVSNVFSATYLNYFMTYTGITTASGATIDLRFATGGTPNTNANYQGGSWRINYNSGGGNAPGYASNQTSIVAGITTDGGATPSHGTVYFFNPFTAAQTGFISSSAGSNQTIFTNGIFNASTSFDGVTILSAQAITGTFRFYGIANS